ncbi:hypothetical protein [Bradyrhizobium sp. CB3481]|uniref:hypothetical protein n=1 Tax=Bradyrhizobium sp. CB3481 TaxID=3039158 RepID=UPI0024B2620F|nr:hypothetical protein [Bradyrhizobium sp. CB3481]WFU19442.1 hypothetical protein QA643_14480 [Bradyrhizobium sp. CB3481]
MPILQWRCAHGDAPAQTLSCAETVAIAPLDDSVDSNIVRISGCGTIAWFGDGPAITKRIIFGPGIVVVHNPPRLELLTDADRHISALSIGIYSCQGSGNWLEIHFTSTGAAELSRRIDAMEQRLATIERRLRITPELGGG